MRDFLPADVRKREYVIGIIKEVYESYGFEPLETPAVENIETLMGKYGEEGNQLIFKILKRGEKLAASAEEKDLADLALRYDLTVPLARVVANNRNELPKFFKRYQIQPVWRADRPARGRFREFYQCDVDAIGSKSMIVEAELISAVAEILDKLKFDSLEYRILLNHRDILFGLLSSFGIPESNHFAAITIIDKTDKIGIDGVREELARTGISAESLKKYTGFVANLANSSLKLDQSTPYEVNAFLVSELTQILKNHTQASLGLEIVKAILKLSDSSKAQGKILLSPWLARGLSYYTGSIMEIFAKKGDFSGSLGGGGRYDGLIGMFGKEQIPACGFSLGLERILVVMDERGMFPPEIAASAPADAMVTVWNEESVAESLKLANDLRAAGIRVLLYPEPDKLGKQFKYASQLNIPWVCVIGENELAENKVTLKNMETGDQETLSKDEIAATVINKT